MRAFLLFIFKIQNKKSKTYAYLDFTTFNIYTNFLDLMGHFLFY